MEPLSIGKSTAQTGAIVGYPQNRPDLPLVAS